MSAVIVLLQKNAAHVLTDGAAYRADGTLIMAASKAWPMPHLSAVLTTRGALYGLPMVANFFAGMRSFAEMRERAGEIVATATLEHAALLARSETGNLIQAIVAGIGEHGPDAFFVSNQDSPAGPALTVAPAGPLAVMPAVPAALDEMQPIFARGDANKIDPAEDGLAMLEALRRHPDSVAGRPDVAPVHMVGGFAQLTSVTRDGISTRILKRWPDRTGEKINPAGGNSHDALYA